VGAKETGEKNRALRDVLRELLDENALLRAKAALAAMANRRLLRDIKRMLKNRKG
jgi:hypothetical protein